MSRSAIPDPLGVAAATTPEGLAVVAPERTLTYRALDRLVTGTARQLRRMEERVATRVGLYLPNGWQALVLVLAAIRAGKVACPLSTRLPLPGVAAALRAVSAPVVISEHADLDAHLSGEVIVRAPEAVISEARTPEGVCSLALDQPATIIFTSGSMGEARAALHNVGNHYYSAIGSNENISLGPGDRWLLALPLYHVGGLAIVFRCMLAGATLVLTERGLPTGAAIRRHAITHVSLVATQLGRLLDEENGRVPAGMKAVLVGGSAVTPSLLREAQARGYPVHSTYGLTEMTSQVTTTPAGVSPDRLDTAGRLLPHRRIRIGEGGEILVRGEVLFQGYVDGEGLHRPLDAGGWFHTGDRGRLDAEGFLYVLGRTDRMFISGGENIHPEEIEQALCTLDGVEQAVVVPVVDAVFGHRPVAFVKVAGGVPSRAVFAERLEAVLPRFKIPCAFYAWPDETPAHGMKVDRTFFAQYAATIHPR